MKKLVFILFIFPFGILSAQNFSSENIKSYQNKTYHFYMLLGEVQLVLEGDAGYTAKYESEGMYWYNSGSYKLDKGYLKLYPKVCKQFAEDNENIDCENTLGDAWIDLIKDDYSLYYTEYLFVKSKNNKHVLINGDQENDNFRIPVPGTEVPEGQTRMVGSTEVITMGMKKGITTSSVKIRETPSPEGKELAYYPAIFEPELKAVPKDNPVTVIARTTEKQQVSKWENYWYYVQVGAHDGVWMFGEFVKFN